jgi:hypothetical protein
VLLATFREPPRDASKFRGRVSLSARPLKLAQCGLKGLLGCLNRGETVRVTPITGAPERRPSFLQCKYAAMMLLGSGVELLIPLPCRAIGDRGHVLQARQPRSVDRETLQRSSGGGFVEYRHESYATRAPHAGKINAKKCRGSAERGVEVVDNLAGLQRPNTVPAQPFERIRKGARD